MISRRLFLFVGYLFFALAFGSGFKADGSKPI
jgi:hypothetical protein